MKNQYVGDINDFVKYGLFRTLTTVGERSSLIAWLLTPDDLSRDGRKLGYLEAPNAWRYRDPDLFDGLRRLVAEDGRSVAAIAAANLLPGAQFYSELVPRGDMERRRHFAELLERAKGQELVFFDPDNGMEVSSCPAGYRGSDKYLLWRELGDTYRAGHSVLVYQHFRREARGPFIDRMARRIAETTGASNAIAFQTSHVVFFLVPQDAQVAYYISRAQAVEAQWAGVIAPRTVVPSLFDRPAPHGFESDGCWHEHAPRAAQQKA